MNSGEYLYFLKAIHGAYNSVMMFLFVYQGWLGLKVRKERTGSGNRDFFIIRKHRKVGPIIAFLGILGFLSGLALVLIDEGHLFEYPLHFTIGLCLSLLITTTYYLSQKINRLDSPIRAAHSIIGIILIGLYLLQVFIGLVIIF